MADITITAANVIAGSGSKRVSGTAGATITAGQAVYLDTADSKYKLADADGAVGVRSPAGIALNGASNGQPLAVLTSGPITIGGTVTAGVAYYLSPNPGGICPVADVLSGDYPTIMGIATTTAILNIKIQESGVAL